MMRQTLGMQKFKDDDDDLSSAEEKPKKSRKKKKKTKEEQELEFLKMQQANLDKQISKIKGSKKKQKRSARGKKKQESVEELEFDDSDNYSGSSELSDTVVRKEKQVSEKVSHGDIVVENFGSEEQSDNRLDDGSSDVRSQEQQEKKMRGRAGPGRLGNRHIDAIPGSRTNVLSSKVKRSHSRDEEWKF